MHAARGIHKLEVSSLVCEELQAQIQLKNAAVVLKPSESKISPLSPIRDVIPDGRQIYQNLLTYTLHVPKAQEIALYAPLLNALLYEAEFESQMWMLFDCNKAMIACGDAHSHTFFTKLEKGEYTVKLQVRHEKRDVLDKISEANMIALYKLSNSLSMDFYDHYNQCLIGGKKFTSAVCKSSVPRVLYVAPFAQEKLTKSNLPSNCAWLSGTITLAKDEAGKRVDTQEFTYVLSPAENSKKNGSNGAAAAAASSSSSNSANASACSSSTSLAKSKSQTNGTTPAAGDAPSNISCNSSNNGSSSPKKTKSSADEYAEGLRDFQCSMMSKCGKFCNIATSL